MDCPNCAPPRLDLSRLGAKLREGARLMVGLPDYDNYLRHRQARHADAPAMTREEFFRERQARRYGEGGGSRVFRCC